MGARDSQISQNLKEKPPDGYTWSGERLTRKQKTSRPRQIVARNVETHVRCIQI